MSVKSDKGAFDYSLTGVYNMITIQKKIYMGVFAITIPADNIGVKE